MCGGWAHLFSPGVFPFCVKEFKSSAPRLGQGPQHVTIGSRADGTESNDHGCTENMIRHREVQKGSRRPESTGEEATVLHAAPEQLQGQLRVLDVTVGQQQQIPEAAGGRQQAEGPQGPPQLGAASYRSETLRRGGDGDCDAFRGFSMPQENFHRALA